MMIVKNIKFTALFYLFTIIVSFGAKAQITDEAFHSFENLIRKAVHITDFMNVSNYSRYQLEHTLNYIYLNPDLEYDFHNGRNLDDICDNPKVLAELKDVTGKASLNDFYAEHYMNRKTEFLNILENNREGLKVMLVADDLEEALQRSNISKFDDSIDLNVKKHIENMKKNVTGMVLLENDPVNIRKVNPDMVDDVLDTFYSSKEFIDAKSANQFFIEFDQHLMKVDLSKSSKIQKLNNIKFTIPNPVQEEMIKSVMTGYFDDTLPLYQKRRMVESLLKIEGELGRLRTVPKGPRIIDIDLIFLGTKVYKDNIVEIPHPRAFNRSFVILPLKELPYYSTIKQFFKIPINFKNRRINRSKNFFIY